MISSRILKGLMKGGAFLCLGLGLLGIFLPLLPTAPFFILATILSYNSSPRLRRWLLRHPVFGSTIRNYLRNRAITTRVLRSALITLWAGLLVSALLVQNATVALVLGGIGSAVTIYLLRLKRIDPQ